MNQLEWLNAKIQEDIKDQNHKIESIKRINEDGSHYHQQIQELKEKVEKMKNQIINEQMHWKDRERQSRERDK